MKQPAAMRLPEPETSAVRGEASLDDLFQGVARGRSDEGVHDHWMTNELDTLANGMYVKTDDLLTVSPYLARWRPAVGITLKRCTCAYSAGAMAGV